VAHHVAADDRAVAVAVGRDEHREHGAGGAAVFEARPALEAAPPVVGALAVAAEGEVDLLVLVLAHVTDREVARQSVKREPPRIAQTIRPDLRSLAGPADERVVGRDRIAAARARADPQDLAV